MSSAPGDAAHMNFMSAPNTIKPADIDLTAPLQEGLKAFMAATKQVESEDWDSLPGQVKEAMGRQFLPFLWHALPGILDQVNAKNTAESAATLNVPDSLEGLL